MLKYMRMVLWSFIGIGGGDARRADLSAVRPLVLLGVALLLAAMFGLTLWALANIAVHALGTPA